MLSRTRKVVTRTLEILVIAIILVVSLSYIYFRYYKETTFRYNKSLSREAVSDVNVFTDSINIANGIQIVKVDLDNNVRYVLYSYFKDPALEEIYKNFANSRITAEIPVFSKNDIENSRVIRLMNHKVDCVPLEQTISYRLAPGSSKFVKTICTISIPPAYNEFKGIIALSLSRPPNVSEKEEIEKVLNQLSERLYKEVK